MERFEDTAILVKKCGEGKHRIGVVNCEYPLAV